MKPVGLIAAAVILFNAAVSFAATNAFPAPPPIQREFRGAWIATVGNINWPSKPGLPVAQQKAELLRILDDARDLKLNAILFQVRPAGDAFYKSDIEPWSEYLTGEMGRAPEPFYDPLAFAVSEAHARGLELHAWFNPYRAGILPRKSAVSAKHIAKTRPWLVKRYANYQWLDPGEDAVKDHTTRVILDVVRRYDIDGVHFDDYFYPYKEKDARGNWMEFPDSGSYAAYRKKGGRLERDDWRRQNVNELVERLNRQIQAIKPWVRFGISPFGIWRPGNPPGVAGLDAYAHLYADARKWVHEGWVDYVAPQLYWRINAPKQSYPELLKWWLGENPRGRHVWPGSTLSGVGEPKPAGWPAQEILEQFTLARTLNDQPGHIIWNYNRILANNDNVRTLLDQKFYTQAAVPPAFPWLDSKPPLRPTATISPADSAHKTTIRFQLAERAWLWALQTRLGTNWTTEIIPGQFNARSFTRDKKPDLLSLIAIDRCGNFSPPLQLDLRTAPTVTSPR